MLVATPQWNTAVTYATTVAYVTYLPIEQDMHRNNVVTTWPASRPTAFSEDNVGRYVVIIPGRTVAPEELGLAG